MIFDLVQQILRFTNNSKTILLRETFLKKFSQQFSQELSVVSAFVKPIFSVRATMSPNEGKLTLANEQSIACLKKNLYRLSVINISFKITQKFQINTHYYIQFLLCYLKYIDKNFHTNNPTQLARKWKKSIAATQCYAVTNFRSSAISHKVTVLLIIMEF